MGLPGDLEQVLGTAGRRDGIGPIFPAHPRLILYVITRDTTQNLQRGMKGGSRAKVERPLFVSKAVLCHRRSAHILGLASRSCDNVARWDDAMTSQNHKIGRGLEGGYIIFERPSGSPIFPEER